MRADRIPTVGLVLMGLLAAGCASDPPPPRGPTMEQFQEVSERLDAALQETEGLREQVARATAETRTAREAAAVASLEAAKLGIEIKRLQKDLDAGAAAREAGAQDDPGAPDSFRKGRARDDSGCRVLKGTVLAADVKMGLYLISIGKKQDVREGDELTVYRGESFVAVVVVDRVFEDKASVCVKKVKDKPFQKSEIRPGDKVANTF
jgi:hypothetical protein